MTFSVRESVLAWVTMAVLLGGATYLLGRAKIQDWKAVQEARVNAAQQIELDTRLVDQRDEWATRLEASTGKLQTYPEGVKVTSALLESIEQIARANALSFDSLSPDNEKEIGNISAVAIKCSWKGDLEACVRFLYALQSKAAMYKVRNLTIAPTGKSGQLKGLFTVDCAYSRTSPEAESSLSVVPVTPP